MKTPAVGEEKTVMQGSRRMMRTEETNRDDDDNNRVYMMRAGGETGHSRSQSRKECNLCFKLFSRAYFRRHRCVGGARYSSVINLEMGQ